MSSPLDGVRIKLKRARDLAQELQEAISPILRGYDDAIFREIDPETQELVYKLREDPFIDPIWSVIFGEGIFCLRSALDHLAWQLVELDGGKPGDHTQFPILESETDKKGAQRSPEIQPKIKRTDIRDAIEAVQPYNRGGRWVDQIWVVNELNRIDKHRLLLTLLAGMTLDISPAGVPEGAPSRTYRFATLETISTTREVARVGFGGMPPPNQFDFRPGLQVCLADAPQDSGYRLQHLPDMLGGLEKAISLAVDLNFTNLFPDERQIWIYP